MNMSPDPGRDHPVVVSATAFLMLANYEAGRTKSPRPDCTTCRGVGWVCEDHGTHPWAGVFEGEDACDDGAGMPCEECFEPGDCPDDSGIFHE